MGCRLTVCPDAVRACVRSQAAANLAALPNVVLGVHEDVHVALESGSRLVGV